MYEMGQAEANKMLFALWHADGKTENRARGRCASYIEKSAGQFLAIHRPTAILIDSLETGFGIRKFISHLLFDLMAFGGVDPTGQSGNLNI